MKFIKLLSAVLVLAMLGCMFVACGETSDEVEELPERELYSITVSFQIKDGTGKTVIDAKDYNYKSHSAPTMLNIINTYLSVEEDWVCKIDKKTNTITQIGGMKADKKDGQYWGFVNGQINLNKEQVMKELSDGKMSEITISDGGVFTVMLILDN